MPVGNDGPGPELRGLDMGGVHGRWGLAGPRGVVAPVRDGIRESRGKLPEKIALIR